MKISEKRWTFWKVPFSSILPMAKACLKSQREILVTEKSYVDGINLFCVEYQNEIIDSVLIFLSALKQFHVFSQQFFYRHWELSFYCVSSAWVLISMHKLCSESKDSSQRFFAIFHYAQRCWRINKEKVIVWMIDMFLSHPAFTCSKLIIETLEQAVKYAQS